MLMAKRNRCPRRPGHETVKDRNYGLIIWKYRGYRGGSDPAGPGPNHSAR